MTGFRKHFTAVNMLCAALCLGYIYLYWKNLSPYWFSPKWTTDDALQQAFPFHAARHPHIFKDDLLFNAMKGYLPPLHYAAGWALTWLSGDPVMTGHWMMLIQITASALFLFLGVRVLAGAAPACLAVMWLLHTRHTLQRLTGGLPRGWALPLLASFVYFLLKKNYPAVFALLFVGCLLHPPATFICALAFGMVLCWEVLWRSSRKEAFRTLCALALLTPVYLGTLYLATKRPAYMGDVVSYAQAAKMPEFRNPGGRFPFVPLPDPWTEVRLFGFQPFFHPIYAPGVWWHGTYQRFRFWKPYLSIAIPLLFIVLLVAGKLRGREIIPARLVWMLPAICAAYGASRIFAFKLFVPDRYLQYPLTIFWIAAFCIGLWRLFHRMPPCGCSQDAYQDSRLKYAWPSIAAFFILAAVVIVGGGTGLYGSNNFNCPMDKHGRIFRWIRSHTPEDAYFAGHPTHVDGLPLFGMRRTLATTETTHPFFPVYLREMMRRLRISLKAHYARDLGELVSLLKPEGVDYFVFSNSKFSSDALAKEKYFTPLDSLVKELTARPPSEYAFRQLPSKLDLGNHPFMRFKDAHSTVVDINLLDKYLNHKEAL